jgi:hypothetical protein
LDAVDVRIFVLLEGELLCFAGVSQRLHYLCDKTGTVAAGVCCVLPAYDVISVEGEVVAYEHPSADSDTEAELLVLTIPTANGIVVVAVR